MLKKIIQYFLQLFYPVFKKILPYRVYAYLAVGAANTALNIGLYTLLYRLIIPQPGVMIRDFLVASYTISLLIAFLVTVPTGYWLAKHFAFNTGANVPSQNFKQIGRYFIVVLQGLGSDYLILKGLIVFFNVDPVMAKIISTLIVLTVNYLLQKYFTFKMK